ncbi:MAG: tetratricopeptide repeat protein, partial [Planctomycetota bacterium]
MIELTSERIDHLFDATCDRVRSSVRQTRESILHLSRQRLAKDARDSEAIHVLAASSLARRKPSESLRILRLQDESFLENALGNRLAGYAWLLKNDPDQAHDYFDRAVRLDPHLTDCWNLLGRIAERREQHEDAAAYYRRALVFEHADAESAIALSKLQAKRRQVRDAIHTLRICLLRDQRSPKLNLALARLLERRAVALSKQRYDKRAHRLREETLECYQRVNAAAPTCKTWIAQGLVEQRLDRMGDAKRSFERAVALDPRSSMALSSLAAANVDLGQLEKAAEQFESSFAIDPTRGISHFRYARAKKFKAGTATTRYLEQLRNLLGSPSLPRRQRLHLNFAIGKVLDDLGEHDEAWAHFDGGNRLNPGHSSR